MKFVRPTLAFFFLLSMASAHALEVAPYTPEALAQAEQGDKAYTLHFHADWCPVCRAQTKVINGLKSDKSLNVTVFVVNYDKEKPLRSHYKVRTQSTLIAFKGKTETGRLAGETDVERIREILSSPL